MPLTGELTDLSLAELIEFFCNQRKDGRLEVVCDDGAGRFYLSSGAVVHAEIGALRGIDAIHYTLTVPNASFTFASGIEAPEQTIDQSWQSVVLEGLRLMDEGVKPPMAFTEKSRAKRKAIKTTKQQEQPSSDAVGSAQQLTTVGDISIGRASVRADRAAALPSFLIEAENTRSVYGPWKLAAVLMAMILVLAVISVPWGWYARSKAAKLAGGTTNLTSGNPSANNSPESAGRANLVSSSWYSGADDYVRANDEHRSVRAPLLIYFRTDWCPYCKKLDEEILPSDEVSAFMRTVVKIRVNPEAGPNERKLADEFGVKGYPSMFVIPADSANPTKIYPFQKVGQTFVALTPREFVSACEAPSLK